MKLKKELEKGSDYKEGRQGKRARYNASTQETLTNELNNEQAASMVKVPSNYLQVLQAPASTDVQMDVD